VCGRWVGGRRGGEGGGAGRQTASRNAYGGRWGVAHPKLVADIIVCGRRAGRACPLTHPKRQMSRRLLSTCPAVASMQITCPNLNVATCAVSAIPSGMPRLLASSSSSDAMSGSTLARVPKRARDRVRMPVASTAPVALSAFNAVQERRTTECHVVGCQETSTNHNPRQPKSAA